MSRHKHKFRILKEVYTNDFVLYCEQCVELRRVKDISKVQVEDGGVKNG